MYPISKTRVAFGVVLSLILFSGCQAGKNTPSPVTLTAPATTNKKPDPIEVTKQALEKNPTYENSIALGLAYSNANRHKEALAEFQHSLALKPDSAVAFNNICNEYNVLKQWTLAAENCKKSLAIKPDFDLAKNNLALALHSIDQQDVDLAKLKASIPKAKDPDAVRLDLGMAYFNRGDYARSIAVWKEIGEKSPDYAIAQNDLGSSWILLKDLHQAKKALDIALKLQPKNPLFNNNARWLAAEVTKAADASQPKAKQ